MLPENQKPAWWKVVFGLLLIVVEINSRIRPAPNLLKASNSGEQVGMNAAMFAIIVVGCWLVYSGAKPLWRKTQ
jgi:hypothetical protein